MNSLYRWSAPAFLGGNGRPSCPRRLLLLLHLHPPRRLLGVGDHRHGDAVAAEVDPRRPRLGAAVRRRPIDLHVPPLRLEDPLALGLDQHPERLAAEPDLGRRRQVGGRLVEVLAVAVEPAGHLADPEADGPLGGVQPRVQGRNAFPRGSTSAAATTRPLIVSTVKSCRPLFRLVLPVCGSAGGGKSGFRRIDSHLHGRLVGLPAKAREEVADLLLAGRDDIPGGASLTASATWPSVASIC